MTRGFESAKANIITLFSIDLTSANHVHLLEPHWAPMAEEQAIARVHRIGQQRHVTATKYTTPDSIEEVSRNNLRLSSNSVASKHGLTLLVVCSKHSISKETTYPGYVEC